MEVTGEDGENAGREGGREEDVLSWHSSLLLRETIGIECGPRVVHTLPPGPSFPRPVFFAARPHVFVSLSWYL